MNSGSLDGNGFQQFAAVPVRHALKLEWLGQTDDLGMPKFLPPLPKPQQTGYESDAPNCHGSAFCPQVTTAPQPRIRARCCPDLTMVPCACGTSTAAAVCRCSRVTRQELCVRLGAATADVRSPATGPAAFDAGISRPSGARSERREIQLGLGLAGCPTRPAGGFDPSRSASDLAGDRHAAAQSSPRRDRGPTRVRRRREAW